LLFNRKRNLKNGTIIAQIALTLGLTNAQVITWFQNRRAKLKRDMEELKKDVESAKILGSHHHHHHHQHHHKAFIGAHMDLNMLQKKADEYNQAIAAASD
jgi:homeobox protein LBX